MKVTDYIVSFLVEQGVSHAFGYPGGSVTHLLHSFNKYEKQIAAHLTYHEQGAAFAACGYAQIALKPGVAYATGGPGASNLMTGLCNAYLDSIPVIFFTGQVNTYESKGTIPIRQRSFQEMDVIPMVSAYTKYCAYVDKAEDIRYHLENAYHCAISGRPGPVLLDLPMNIQRSDINPEELIGFMPSVSITEDEKACTAIENALLNAKRPCVLVGGAVRSNDAHRLLSKWIDNIGVPVVSSMVAVDALPQNRHYYGFIGAYGARCANFIMAKSDLIISIGSRLDLRQTGNDRSNFAVNAKLIRLDIDVNEFKNVIKKDEITFFSDIRKIMPLLANSEKEYPDYSSWLLVCDELKEKLLYLDDQPGNELVRSISRLIPKDAIVTADVGQNQIWVAQSFECSGQRILFSGGLGAMGFSLPAGIGASLADDTKSVFSFCGDGGIQMNIQELQFLARENLPVKIILLNNSSLGMIRHFEEMYFDSAYVHTKIGSGYDTPDFMALAWAYGIQYLKVADQTDINSLVPIFENSYPALIEVALNDETILAPKLATGKTNQDQEPPLDRKLFHYLERL